MTTTVIGVERARAVALAIKNRLPHGIPVGTYTASGAGGQRLTGLPELDTVVVNLMNTDVDGPRLPK